VKVGNCMVFPPFYRVLKKEKKDKEVEKNKGKKEKEGINQLHI
jgi:hypothetical protein